MLVFGLSYTWVSFVICVGLICHVCRYFFVICGCWSAARVHSISFVIYVGLFCHICRSLSPDLFVSLAIYVGLLCQSASRVIDDGLFCHVRRSFLLHLKVSFVKRNVFVSFAMHVCLFSHQCSSLWSLICKVTFVILLICFVVCAGLFCRICRFLLAYTCRSHFSYT